MKNFNVCQKQISSTKVEIEGNSSQKNVFSSRTLGTMYLLTNTFVQLKTVFNESRYSYLFRYWIEGVFFSRVQELKI